MIDSARQSGVRPRSASRTGRAVEQCVYRRRDPDRADNPACDAVTVTPGTLGTNADGRFDEPQYRNDRRAPLEVRGHRRGSARAASRRHARPADELRRRAAANTRKTVARFADGLAIARRHEVTSLDPVANLPNGQVPSEPAARARRSRLARLVRRSGRLRNAQGTHRRQGARWMTRPMEAHRRLPGPGARRQRRAPSTCVAAPRAASPAACAVGAPGQRLRRRARRLSRKRVPAPRLRGADRPDRDGRRVIGLYRGRECPLATVYLASQNRFQPQCAHVLPERA